MSLYVQNEIAITNFELQSSHFSCRPVTQNHPSWLSSDGASINHTFNTSKVQCISIFSRQKLNRNWSSNWSSVVKIIRVPYRRHQFNPLVGKSPWRRKRQPTPMFLPGNSHGQRSLAAYSAQGHKESDMTAAEQQHEMLSSGTLRDSLAHSQDVHTLFWK